MNVLELFAGIGGISLGFEWSGVDVVGQVELDPFARRVLARHWPGVPRHDDVRTALPWWHSEPRPVVDIVAGGYPCQPESNAGRRRSTDDARWLWPEFASIVDDLRPAYVLGENVMGHRTRGLRFVLADLAELGYAARAGIISAAEVGAPHIRKRIFVLAKRRDPVPDTDRGARWNQPGRDESACRQGPAELGDHGGPEPVAHPDRAPGRPETGHAVFGARAGALGLGAPEPGRCGAPARDLPDPDGPRLGPRWGDGRDDAAPSPEDEHGAYALGSSWWATEPGLGRVAYGLPNRVDRLRTLGNAVVPQVAYAVVQLLLSDRWLEA